MIATGLSSWLILFVGVLFCFYFSIMAYFWTLDYDLWSVPQRTVTKLIKMLKFIFKCKINSLKCTVWYSNLGNIHNSLKAFSSAPKALKRAAVQSPATLMWTLKKSSSGAEVRVKGCHSNGEIDEHCRKIYWPASILKPCFFMWSSRTPEECVTTWNIVKGFT